MKRLVFFLALFFFGLALEAQTSPAPTVAQAEEFMNKAEARLAELSIKVNQATWVHDNFITEDTEALAADANDENTAVTTELVEQAKRFEGLQLPPELARKFKLLKLSLTAPAPKDPALRRELTQIAASLESDYGKGKYCRKPDDCLDITSIENIMGASRDPNELKDLWTGWHKVGVPMRQRYARFVALSNQGAREIGFKDTGAMWRSNYDMPPEAFSADLERLWQQVRPLYLSLHAYVRSKLMQKYGPQLVPPDGPIPAHLLGNPWAQEWENTFPLLGLPENSGVDVTALLKAKNLDPKGMVKYGENFFISMGFAPLPQTFWERSLFVKPRDRDVVCHASAWDIDNKDDLRIKTCLQIRDVDFVPDYLHKVGLLEKVPEGDNDIPQLLQQALDRVAFLPFGLLIDQWRWKVFSGEVTPADYNKSWWDMRLKYQGVAPPVARGEADFDPGAKYHVAGNVPYMRYFLAHILEFQFYRALCQASGYTGPLHRCTFLGSKEAGAKFNKMLEMGQSKPWPDALEVLTGERQIDGGALLEYFAPLKKWLDEQNKGQKVGW